MGYIDHFSVRKTLGVHKYYAPQQISLIQNQKEVLLLTVFTTASHSESCRDKKICLLQVHEMVEEKEKLSAVLLKSQLNRYFRDAGHADSLA